MSTTYEDGVFFHTATNLLGIEDIRLALREFYTYLERSFPLEAIVVHHFLPNASMLLNLYFLNHQEMEFLGSVVPFSREQALFLRAFSMTGGVNYVPDSTQSRTACSVVSLLGNWIDSRPRAHMVCCLKTAHGSEGLLRLIGRSVDCFTMEHRRRLSMLSLPLGFALYKLLSLPETQHFLQEKGYEEARSTEEHKEPFPKLIGANGGLKDLMETVRKLSITDAPVLILGETGTGKELVANAIQSGSSRRNKPFIKVNCGAIPETLMDSTLFGHEKGAFTGAHCTTPGKFEQANGGTLFLDEVGELTLQAQVRLLRTLQNHVVERVGSTDSIPINVRIIAATNRDLPSMLARGTFREDLYYRLNVFTLHVPPLRDRLQDLLPLARHFIDNATKRMGLPPILGIHPKSMEKLLHYPWPGNVRELENLIERALIMNYGETLRLDEYLPKMTEEIRPFAYDEIFRQRVTEVVMACLAKHEWPVERLAGQAPHEEKGEDEPLQPLNDVIKDHIVRALKYTNGKIHGPGGAGELLGVHPDTLRKRMQKLGISTRTGKRG